VISWSLLGSLLESLLEDDGGKACEGGKAGESPREARLLLWSTHQGGGTPLGWCLPGLKVYSMSPTWWRAGSHLPLPGKQLPIGSRHKKCNKSWVPVAHACNPSYSGGSQFEASLGK
jgi:hypothetical protein